MRSHECPKVLHCLATGRGGRGTWDQVIFGCLFFFFLFFLTGVFGFVVFFWFCLFFFLNAGVVGRENQTTRNHLHSFSLPAPEVIKWWLQV